MICLAGHYSPLHLAKQIFQKGSVGPLAVSSQAAFSLRKQGYGCVHMSDRTYATNHVLP